jgi:hypothetical protein
MQMTISEADWKVYKRIRDLAWERYAQRILDEVADLCRDETELATERFARLAPLVRQRDKASYHIFDTLRRSSAVRCLIAMRGHGLVTPGAVRGMAGYPQQGACAARGLSATAGGALLGAGSDRGRGGV